jgi:hypothetical protein
VLAEEIVKPGVEAVSMFRNVQLRVRDAVRQEPWLSYGTLSPVWFADKTGSGLPIPPMPVPVRRSEAAEAWEATRNATDATVLERFIARYRDTYFADLARARLAELDKSLPSAAGGRKPPDTSCSGKIAGSWDVAEETVFPATLVMPGHQEAEWEFKSDRPLGGVVFLNASERKRYSCQGNSYTIHDFFGITLTLAPDGTRLDGECHDLVSAAGGGCRIHAVRK